MSAKGNKKRMGEGETNKTNEEKRKYLRKEKKKGKENIGIKNGRKRIYKYEIRKQKKIFR